MEVKEDDEEISYELDALQNDEALGLFPEGTINMAKEEKAKKWDLGKISICEEFRHISYAFHNIS